MPQVRNHLPISTFSAINQQLQPCTGFALTCSPVSPASPGSPGEPWGHGQVSSECSGWLCPDASAHRDAGLAWLPLLPPQPWVADPPWSSRLPPHAEGSNLALGNASWSKTIISVWPAGGLFDQIVYTHLHRLVIYYIARSPASFPGRGTWPLARNLKPAIWHKYTYVVPSHTHTCHQLPYVHCTIASSTAEHQCADDVLLALPWILVPLVVQASRAPHPHPAGEAAMLLAQRQQRERVFTVTAPGKLAGPYPQSPLACEASVPGHT